MDISNWLPTPPNEGPPLPKILGIYWPWYKATMSTKGHIVINTVPSGATISVNGSTVGASPITVDVDPGSYTILIQSSGYNDATTTVTVAAGETHTLNVSLTATGGRTPIDIVWS